MFDFYYYLYTCLYIERTFCLNYKEYVKFLDFIEIRVRVREEDFRLLMSRVAVLLEFLGKVSGATAEVKDITDRRKHIANVIEVTVMLSGFRAMMFQRLVFFLLLPAYVNKFGYRPEWVSYEDCVKLYLTNPSFFFNYVSGDREDFEEHVLMIMRKKYA